MKVEPYVSQLAGLPSAGRSVVASYDHESIVVYQAYRAEIAEWAVGHNALGGALFSFDRMSWIKTSFLWMMYRSGWGTKPQQSNILAIRVARATFDALVEAAVPAQYDEDKDASPAAWRQRIRGSDVRIQWDPDRDPNGSPLDRRAIQIGLRGGTLSRFAQEDILSIADITPFVVEQRGVLTSGEAEAVMVPKQRTYPSAPMPR